MDSARTFVRLGFRISAVVAGGILAYLLVPSAAGAALTWAHGGSDGEPLSVGSIVNVGVPVEGGCHYSRPTETRIDVTRDILNRAEDTRGSVGVRRAIHFTQTAECVLSVSALVEEVILHEGLPFDPLANITPSQPAYHSYAHGCGTLTAHQGTRTVYGPSDWLTWKEGELDWCENYDWWEIWINSYTPRCDANSRHTFYVRNCYTEHTDRSATAVWGRSFGDMSWWSGGYYHWYKDEEVARLDPAVPYSCYFWDSGTVPGAPDPDTCTMIPYGYPSP